MKELQQWKDQTTSMVDLQKYTKLQIDLVDSQRSLRDLQESISNREEVVSKKLKGQTILQISGNLNCSIQPNMRTVCQRFTKPRPE